MRVLLAALLLAQPAMAGPVTVEVSGAGAGQGQILATLFRGEAAWMKTPAAERTVPVDAAGGAFVDFGEQPAGTYGVSLIHDEDMDGELDLNLIGIPSERFGFSNDAAALIGVPGWEKVRFEVGAEGAAIAIRLDRAE